MADPTNQYNINPQDYLGIVNSAYSNLGQAGSDTAAAHPGGGTDTLGLAVGDRIGAANKFASDLAKSFVDRYHKQTGQVPNEDQVHQFISQNANISNAMKYVQGQINPDQMNTMADQYMQTNTDTGTQAQGIDQTLPNSLQQYADQQYQYGAQQLGQDTQNQYQTQKRGLVEDLASQNQLGQANSRYSLNDLEANKNQELQRGITNLLGQRASTMTGLGVTGAQMAQQNKQFGVTAGLQRQGMQNEQDINATNLGLQRVQMGLASQLGKQQAEANKPGAFDWAKLAVGAVPIVGGAASAGMGLYQGLKSS